jgi:hypothetical protein
MDKGMPLLWLLAREISIPKLKSGFATPICLCRGANKTGQWCATKGGMMLGASCQKAAGL